MKINDDDKDENKEIKLMFEKFNKELKGKNCDLVLNNIINLYGTLLFYGIVKCDYVCVKEEIFYNQVKKFAIMLGSVDSMLEDDSLKKTIN